MKNVFFGSKAMINPQVAQPLYRSMATNDFVYATPQIPLSTTDQMTIDDWTDYDDINNGLSNFFNVAGGRGRNLYCLPEYGSDLIDYLRDTDAAKRSAQRINELVQSDLKKLSRISTILSINLQFSGGATLTTTNTIGLSISYSNSKIGDSHQWSGIIFDQSN